MTQRVLIAACLIATLAILSLQRLVWHQSNRAISAIAAATRRSTEMQAADHANTIELLTRLQATSATRLEQSHG